MKVKYRLRCFKSDKNKQFYVSVIKRNHQIAWQSEGYEKRQGALKAAKTLKDDLREGYAEIIDETKPPAKK